MSNRYLISILSLFLVLHYSSVVKAHSGHNHEFTAPETINQNTEAVKVDPQTMQRLGLKVESVLYKPILLAINIPIEDEKN